nr:zinc finger, CCHC-type [Tanacetum cinerariifolium]
MSSDTKLTKDEECEFVDSTKCRGMIGSLFYLTTSRPDIMFRVCLCARFQDDPKTSHLEAVKRIFRYIKSTTHLGLLYPKGTGIETVVYADSDHAEDYVHRKITSGICTFLGCCLTLWFSKKHIALTISMTEAEYVRARKTCEIDLSKNPMQHSRTKHIEIRHRFLQDNVQKGNISIKKVSSEDNIANILTKPLKRESFNYIRLAVSIPSRSHYQTNPPTPDEIKLYVQLERRLILPYCMLLSRLFNHVMSNFTELSNDQYVLYDRVMYPFASEHERKMRKDYGTKKGRHSTSASSSSFDHLSFSHHVDVDDDENDEGTSRVSIPSATHYSNSLSNDIPQVFSNPPHDDQTMANLFTRPTEILNPQVQMRDEHRSGLRLGHVHYKRMQEMSKDGLILAFDMETEKYKTCMLTKITKKPFQNVKRKTKVLELIYSDLCDLHATSSLGNKKYFMTFIDDASRIPNVTEDTGGSMIPEEVIEEVLADLPPGCKPIGYKWIFKKKLKVDGTIEKFKARLVIQGFKQKTGIDYFDTYAPVARISTIRLLIAMESIDNLIIHQMDVKTAFLNGELEEEVDMTKEFLSSRFSMNDIGEANVILVSNPMDTSEKLMHNNGQAVSQLDYSRVIGCLMYAMTCTRSAIAFAVGKLSKYTSNPGTQHCQAIQRIIITKDNSSTSGWVFLLGGGAISLASKKQTCITGSTMKSEFVALVVADKEAERLRNPILEILLWSKPITPISIPCDSEASLAKAYNQMYNGKSRHLGVRHSMIHRLIMNGVVSIEFVRSQQNLADHLTKGLARDLVLKSAEGIGLKSNQVAEC